MLELELFLLAASCFRWETYCCYTCCPFTKTVAAAGSGAVPVPASGNISATPPTLSGEEPEFFTAEDAEEDRLPGPIEQLPLKPPDT